MMKARKIARMIRLIQRLRSSDGSFAKPTGPK
jgi:hypothetical protein